ncbi:rhodanese-like domain-containing protein [Kribbella italica]|uniref:Rhodanese-related sulfurtransferase n=1 Tax=Kribbella italica TaxID=1540520 RepID=A0A7W9JEV7_9ACTN|nr:rhodanese-like domain-containing protein [Kribbella italica]MBB5840522.1 rhodanese-related sulfurtransferase [Kribbella italica]
MPVSEIDRAEVADLIAAGNTVVVEALPEDVYAQGHLPRAVNIRPRRVVELAKTLLPDLDRRVVVYCGSADCDASLRVAQRLTELGYSDVHRYTGGKQDWLDAGLPIEKPAHQLDQCC